MSDSHVEDIRRLIGEMGRLADEVLALVEDEHRPDRCTDHAHRLFGERIHALEMENLRLREGGR